MTESTKLQDILAATAAGERLSKQDALLLYQEAPLIELGKLANDARQKTRPGSIVTFLIDRNINYTNVCSTDCTFCGFYRPDEKHPDSYVLTREQIGEKIEEALELGATRVLLQGGHNDDLDYDFYCELISWLHNTYDIELNCFSPSEILQIGKVSGKSTFEVLSELKVLGLKGLPGGGAEILDDEVRKRVSPKKIKSDEWIRVMEIAQELDITTTSTMVIGFGETLEQRLNHLERLRSLQDRSQGRGHEGFNAFISWTLQHNENTSMGRSRHRLLYGADSVDYLRNVAISRLFLDNIPNHQASWPTLGPEIGKVALHFGCNDFGSTMMEENVVSQAGALTQSKWEMSPEELKNYIRQAGYVPAKRNTSYKVLEIFDEPVDSQQGFIH
jgi:cyclic dehypoxanthinyl futalosine synthase